MGVRVVTFFGIVGGYFIALQLWKRHRGAYSLEEMDKQAANRSRTIDLGTYFRMQEKRNPQYRLLNVNNFGLEHLNGARAPPPNQNL